MKSIRYPDMFSTSKTYTFSDHEAVSSNLKLLLLSDRGALFGDPYYGTNIKKMLQDQNSSYLKEIVIDDIYTSIATFMPELRLSRNNIKVYQERNAVFVEIFCENIISHVVDLYKINLTEFGS